MLYDIIIVLVGSVSAIGAIYFSRKISRETARPIGMVREMAPDSEAKSVAAPEVESGGVDVEWTDTVAIPLPLDRSAKKAMRYDIQQVVVGDYVIADFVAEDAPEHEIWRCHKCGLVQYRGKESKCRKCGHHYFDELRGFTIKDTVKVISETVESHDKVLDKHYEMIATLQAKMQRFEQESAKESKPKPSSFVRDSADTATTHLEN